MALEKSVSEKTAAALPVQGAKKQEESQYIRFKYSTVIVYSISIFFFIYLYRYINFIVKPLLSGFTNVFSLD